MPGKQKLKSIFTSLQSDNWEIMNQLTRVRIYTGQDAV